MINKQQTHEYLIRNNAELISHLCHRRDVIHKIYQRITFLGALYISCVCLVVGLTWSLYLMHTFQEERIPGTTQLSHVPTMRLFNVKRKHVLSFPENCNHSVLFLHKCTPSPRLSRVASSVAIGLTIDNPLPLQLVVVSSLLAHSHSKREFDVFSRFGARECEFI